MAATRLPPGCGDDLNATLLWNGYQAEAIKAQRLRFCLVCKHISSMDDRAKFVCPTCKSEHTSNLTAPRVFNRFGLFAGRRGGKTKVGALMARFEAMVDNSLGWVIGPSFPILRDSTMPTLLRIIPPQWVKNWSQDALELTLTNGAQIMFRSADDPERLRGQGPSWGWLDEAAQASERAWDVFRPSLSENAGIMIFTTTVLGFDWTYKRVELPALRLPKETRTPGWFGARWRTIDNPIFQHNPVLRKEVEEARQTMTPDFFAQEYLGERRNFTGAIYGSMVDSQILHTAEDVKKLIPEWPDIAPHRQILVGLDSGADHPFGAVMGVVTEHGIVIVGEYLQRQRAYIEHLNAMLAVFGKYGHANVKGATWAANKNEAQLRLEFGLREVGITPVENKHEIGIPRVQSWLLAKQLYFAYTCPLTIEQMRMYRRAENTKPDGSKKSKEEVYKRDDELPDGIRYMMMAWPELPKASGSANAADAARLAAFPESVRRQIERSREHREMVTRGNVVELTDKDWPMGTFYGQDDYSEDLGLY